MASAIDPSKPTFGQAYTVDVRDNFAAAHSEIEALQTSADTAVTDIADLKTRLTSAEAAIADLLTRVTALETGGSP